MIPEPRPLTAITHDAIHVLTQTLGVVETARFLQHFGAGQGDYTAERSVLFEGATVKDLVQEAQRLRAVRS